MCALPGGAGDVTISGSVNTYWTPGNGSYSGSIAVSGQRGAAATLVEGDLAMVIQMQCANINSSDSLNYGAGVTRLVMDGGGDNNANSLAAESSGAAGGGIVMIRAVTLTGSGAISARGARAADNPTNDGGGVVITSSLNAPVAAGGVAGVTNTAQT